MRAVRSAGEVAYILGVEVPPIKEVDETLFGEVPFEELVHYVYSQPWLKTPHLRPRELPYLFPIGAGLFQHLHKNLPVAPLGQVFLKQSEDSLP